MHAMHTHTRGCHAMVPQTSQTTSLCACFFYNMFLYFLTNLFIGVTFCIGTLVFFRQVKETNETSPFLL